MALEKNEIRDLYRKRAKRYNLSANLYYLIGFREAKYRKMATTALALNPGDTLVELGCGTGLNFKHAMQDLGPTGKLIGVDLTDGMLQQAEARLKANDWKNITLVQSDIADYAFPSNVNGVFSSFALTLVPQVDAPIAQVWTAYTNPEDIIMWKAASDDWHTTRSEVDLRVGGKFCSRMEAKDGSVGFNFEGVYAAVVPNSLLE